MATHDAGVQVACPGCGQTVLQKAMIPIVGDGGQGLRYLCPACARALVVPSPETAGAGDPQPNSERPTTEPSVLAPPATEPSS